MTVGGALGGLAIFVVLSRRFLPQTPILSRLILPTQTKAKEKDVFENTSELLGTAGHTVTDLRPSAKANILGERMDVIAEGEWISIDTPITVIAVHGRRVMVKSTAQ